MSSSARWVVAERLASDPMGTRVWQLGSAATSRQPALVIYGVAMVNVVGNAVHGANSSSDIGLSYASPHAGTELKIVSE
jgi:hypothetical protein